MNLPTMINLIHLEIWSIDLVPLPGYIPDFTTVKDLWHWMYEDVTYNNGYGAKKDLIE